jgi:hypothetical protein
MATAVMRLSPFEFLRPYISFWVDMNG